MKICHLTSVHAHTDTRIFLKECRSLKKAGYEVHFVVPSVQDTIIDGVQIHGLRKEKGSRLKRMTKTVNQVLKIGLEIDADVYHFHDPELIPVGLKLKKQGKKVIYDVHEDVPKQIMTKNWLPKNLRKVISKTFEQYENRAVKKFDKIITATPYIRDRFLKLGCAVQDVNNYPLLEELKIEDGKWAEKENVVCYVGGISVTRGINEMTMALTYTEDISLLLAGKFAFNTEKEAVKSLDGWSKVKELGFLNREQVKDTYRKSKAGMVVLHPTLNYVDALPVKMFEYMAAGIPVIASNFPLWKSIIEETDSGVCVDPLKPKEIGHAINFLMENPKEAERMGKNGRIAVETKFNWESESQKLIDVYENLLQN
ncbi:glycosyltransferase family 4 protein [Domibacillus iocasae]|uniref:Glycosyl transferase n=1 Tax=Domibacillus iocasae TaxID=1714016 RepID=A0A1E7DPC1_9BACI|nr:glycosyltransferase family 4 protein [Domibacillus iocasae]OES44940.1 glycosyl transferase [Domibacillus iocasae]